MGKYDKNKEILQILEYYMNIPENIYSKVEIDLKVKNDSRNYWTGLKNHKSFSFIETN